MSDKKVTTNPKAKANPKAKTNELSMAELIVSKTAQEEVVERLLVLHPEVRRTRM